MNPEFTNSDREIFEDEHEWFRESVRQFIQRSIEPEAEKIRERHEIGRKIWRVAGENGFLGLGVPTEFGGSGVTDFRFNAILGEELAAGPGLAYASSLGIQTDVVSPYLTELTTTEQKQRWLPGFTSGEIVTAIAMTEPGAGSDLAAIRTQAVPEGDGWRINGSKTFITNGMTADLMIVAARTGTEPKSRHISLFVVEADSDGFRRGRKLEKVGQPEADTAELFFDDVIVPETALLGELGKGFELMMERLPQERLSTACVNVAHARGALEHTVRYAHEREAFGRSIGSFQNTRFALAEALTKIEVTQAYVDLCMMRHVEGRLSPIDAAKAKWWSAEIQNDVLDLCVQIHGGYGYMLEYPVGRAWADGRITKIWAGSNEIMKEIIGRSLGLRG